MINRLFLILISVLILPDIYIYKLFITRSTESALLRCLYFLPTLLLLIGLIWIAFFAGNRLTEDKNHYIGWFITAFMFFVVPKLIFFACSIFDLPLKYLLKLSVTPFSYLGIVLAVACAGIVLYGTLVGKTKFDVKDVTFHSPKLPEAFDGYKIVQLSDIHIGSWSGNEEAIKKAVELVNQQQADLVVFTGDLVNHRAVELNNFQEILAGIKAKDGVYSILGNHDYGPYYHWDSPRDMAQNLDDLKEREAKMGWILLNNEHTFIHRGADSIALVGVENWGKPPFTGYGDLKKANKDTGEGFKLLLSHNPTHWREEVIPLSDIDLMLAGHTHAMQLALGHHSPSSWVYPEWGGMYKEGDQSLYVNVGLGFVGMPFRFGAWPEITVITLKKE